MMKYNITINQHKMIEHDLNITQWCVLDVISVAPTWSEPITKDGQIYFWIARQKIAEELRGLDLKPDTIYRNIKKLVELGFLDYEKLGKKDLIRLSLKGKNLFTATMSDMNPNNDTNNSDMNPTYNTTNKPNIDYDAFLKEWNEFATTNKKSKVAKLSDTRKKKIALRIKDYDNLNEIFTYVLTKASKSVFLKSGSFFTFDWLMENDNNILKVYEGKYDNKESEDVIL